MNKRTQMWMERQKKSYLEDIKKNRETPNAYQLPEYDDLTCAQCEDIDCDFRFDPYNTNGDCLYLK